jgi:hypothetical protein
MLVEPIAMAVSKPVLLTVAAAVLEELQTAELVKFCVLLSLKVPVAVSCSVVPRTTELLGAVMVIDCSVAAVTVSARVFEVTPACVAVMFVEPTPAPVARPLLLIVAAAVFEEFQVAVLLTFWVPPSVNVPVAVN